MTPQEIRLECLRLAQAPNKPAEEVTADAEKLIAFVYSRVARESPKTPPVASAT